MIQLPVSEIVPGMIVARSILGAASGMALAAGYVLDEAVIDRSSTERPGTLAPVAGNCSAC